MEILCINWYRGLPEHGDLSLKRVGEFMFMEYL